MTKRLPIYAAAGALLLAFYACIRHARPPLPPATVTADFAPQTVQIPADSRAANEAAAAASPDAACYLPATRPRAPLSERETVDLLRAGSAAYLRGDHAAAFSVFRQLTAVGNALG